MTCTCVEACSLLILPKFTGAGAETAEGDFDFKDFPRTTQPPEERPTAFAPGLEDEEVWE